MKPLCGIALVFLLTSCQSAELQPWERGTLARPEMQLTTDELGTALYDQVYDSKEASSGGSGAAGAGCGCN